MAKILTEAKVARGTFYFYFASKDAAIRDLVNRVVDDLIGVMSPWGNRRGGSAEEALRSSLTAAAEVWQKHRAVLHACQEGWPMSEDLGELWLRVMERFVGEIEARIRWERDRGLAPVGPDPQQVSATLIWSTERIMYLAGSGHYPGASNEVEAVEPLVDLFLRMIYNDSRSSAD